MKPKYMSFSYLPIVLLALVTLPLLARTQDHVVITRKIANIRTLPNGTVVAQARCGDVFVFGGRDGDWFSILMFSGEYRYVHSSLARPTDSAPVQPSEATRRRAFQSFVRAEDRAMVEADRQIPPTTRATIMRNIDLQRILNDRYKLEVCHRFRGIQPAHYKSLMIEGVRKGWMP